MLGNMVEVILQVAGRRAMLVFSPALQRRCKLFSYLLLDNHEPMVLINYIWILVVQVQSQVEGVLSLVEFYYLWLWIIWNLNRQLEERLPSQRLAAKTRLIIHRCGRH